jgi:hypothetical protein
MRRILTTAAGAAAIATSLIMAGTASASTGTTEISPEQAGYTATGAQFKTISAAVFLRQPGRYSGEVASVGQSVQLWSSGLVAVVGFSASTSGSDYTPYAKIFDARSHQLLASNPNAEWCDATDNCGPTIGSLGFGVTVQFELSYDQKTGDVTFRAYPDEGHEAFLASYTAGTGVSFTQARVGAEFSGDPWTAPSYTPPAKWTKIAVYNHVRLVTYSGKASTLTSWWVHHALEANTEAQSTSGDWVAVPTNLYNKGASFQTFFVPTSGQRPAGGTPLVPRA